MDAFFPAIVAIFLAWVVFLFALIAIKGWFKPRGRQGDIPWWASDDFDASRNPEANSQEPHRPADSSASHAHHGHQHHHHDHHMPSMPDMSSHHHAGGFDAGAHSGGSHHSH